MYTNMKQIHHFFLSLFFLQTWGRTVFPFGLAPVLAGFTRLKDMRLW